MTDRRQERTKAERARRVNWRVLLGLLVSGVSLFIAVQNLQPLEVWQAFLKANYLWITPAVALYLFALVARTARWQALLSSERHIPLRELLPTMAMGRGANNIYPFRAGEIVRVLLLRQRNAVSGAAGLASILVERVFDGLTMILFLLIAALIGGLPEAQQVQLLGQMADVDLRYLLWTAIGVFGAALGVIYALVLWPGPIQRLAGQFVERLVPHRFRPQMHSVVKRFIQGFSSVKSAWTLTLVLFFSVAVWTAETISYRLVMNSFGFGVDLHHLLLMSGAANLGTALPSGPGNVGTFDLPAIFILQLSGVPQELAISNQLLLHAILWCTETFAGLWFMWHAGLGKADLDRALAGQGVQSPGAKA